METYGFIIIFMDLCRFFDDFSSYIEDLHEIHNKEGENESANRRECNVCIKEML